MLINSNKVAGILTEVSSEIDRLTYAVIGVGINVNTVSDDLPHRPLFPAGSLASAGGHHYDRAHLLASWIDCFAAEYQQLLNGGRNRLMEHWQELSNVIGRKVTVSRINDTISGTVSAIRHDGALQVQTADGEIVPVLSGDVSYN